jgi:MFS family permease
MSLDPRSAVRRLAAARLLSALGSDAAAVALSFTLYRQTGSVAWLSASMLVSLGLTSVLAGPCGTLADRFDRRKLMIGADLAAAATFAAMTFIHTPVALLVLTLFGTLAGNVVGPASGAAIPVLAGPERLAWANGILSASSAIGSTAGRLAGGVAAAMLGPALVFGVNATSFLVSAVLVAGVRGRFQEPRAEDAPPVRSLAMREVLAHPVVRMVVLCGGIASLMTSLSMLAELPLVDLYGTGAAGLGALSAAWAAGQVLGSWAAARFLTPDSEPTGLMVGRIAMGVSLAMVAVFPGMAGAIVCYVAGGTAGGFLLVAAGSMLQRAADDSVRGRALAVADAAKNAFFGVGTLAGGILVAGLPVHAVYLAVGCGVVASALPAWRLVRVVTPAPLGATAAA